jgi:hypothetical protein
VTADEAVTITHQHVERQFPLTCSTCGTVYRSLADYLQHTTHSGQPVSYDAEQGDWKPKAPVGTFSFANCSCGTTLAISSEGIGLLTMWRLMRWGRQEMRRRNTNMRGVLEWVRSEVDKRALVNANRDTGALFGGPSNEDT